MPELRLINKVVKNKPTIEGAGVHLKRVFGFNEESLFDPFLLLDDFRSDNPEDYRKGFPWHPHRGIETITYVLSGEVDHGDSLGNNGSIGAGDVQWMTAGSGIIHQEMPQGDERGRMYGFQLWANLPAREKMTDPRYRDVTSQQIPVVTLPNGTVIRVVAGELKAPTGEGSGSVKGPVQDVVIEPEYLDVLLPAGSEFRHPTPPGHTVFAYVIEGRGIFGREDDPFSYEAEGAGYFDMERSRSFGDGTLVLYNDGEEVSITTEDEPVRFLLVSGRPLREPVAWYGPIVMNTREELRTAFEELDNGNFIKYSG